MAIQSQSDLARELESVGMLRRVSEELDPRLELAAVQRRVFAAGGPALLFTNVKGTEFPVLANAFGQIDRARYIFRRTLSGVSALVGARANPQQLLQNPMQLLRAVRAAAHAFPLPAWRAPALQRRLRISDLPMIVGWPRDGGAFITLPQALSEHPRLPGWRHSNLGMYRVQLNGNRYQRDEEIGLHYQIRRGIGVHHSLALEQGQRLKVCIAVGGPPAHAFAAVMPLPESMPELAFAGALAGRNLRWRRVDGVLAPVDADFLITGEIADELKPEGPFGDHLGYYSLRHPFPVLRVRGVYARSNAVWPMTTVGRPPQEDTIFGKLIHEIAAPMAPVMIPGLRQMHAVDAAGVHPLLLAVGSERFAPYQARQPMELLTIANAVLGFNQASLAKYLWIAASEDDPQLDAHNIPSFLQHMLQRVDWRRDLHFQTATTIDTLDYSGQGLNQGSKLVIAAAGAPRRRLQARVPDIRLPRGFSGLQAAMPGILLLAGPRFRSYRLNDGQLAPLLRCLERCADELQGFPLAALVDDVGFAAATLNNLLWTLFTRSNPSHDIHGAGQEIRHKHWGCKGTLLIDARSKPHHAPPLIEDPRTLKRIDRLFAAGGSLAGID